MDVRRSVAELLYRYGPLSQLPSKISAQIITGLSSALNDKHCWVISSALSSLQALKVRPKGELLQKVTQLLTHSACPGVRQDSIRLVSLADFSGNSHNRIRILIKLLKDKVSYVRLFAAEVLGLIGNQIINSRDPQIRALGPLIVKALGNKLCDFQDPYRFIPPLILLPAIKEYSPHTKASLPGFLCALNKNPDRLSIGRSFAFIILTEMRPKLSSIKGLSEKSKKALERFIKKAAGPR